MNTALLLYPPVGRYLRGEDRCQADVDASCAADLRTPIDLAYMAAVLRQHDMAVHLRDYPADGKGWAHYEQDLKRIRPDLVVMSITTASLIADMRAFEIAKTLNPDMMTVAKGAHFYACEGESLRAFPFMDIAIRGEADTIVDKIVLACRTNVPVSEVPGLFVRHENGGYVRTPDAPFLSDLDTLPFPARDLLRNERYVRPDTGEPQTTVQVSRGCPSQCIFCLSPLISGRRLRSRSTHNVADELEECVLRYSIRNFFFRADTFTMDRGWVRRLCGEILDRGLSIAWAANSKVNTVDDETLGWMKRAGCWLIAFGIESGDEAIQKRLKKGTTIAQARRAVERCKSHGIKTYGFYMIGLPWDTRETIARTLDLAHSLACDFNEFHIATPYEGTALYRISRKLGLIDRPPVGATYFSRPASGTLTLTREEVKELRKRCLRSLYFSPASVARILRHVRSPSELRKYLEYGVRLARNLFAFDRT